MLFIRQHVRVLFALQLLLLGLFISPSWAISDVEIRKSPNDNRQYKGLYLDNGLKVLLVSDPGADKAAAALNVEAGSFNEPTDREGLAHFLEHMLFLGTKKYPQGGEYKEYMNAHGGSENAFTKDRNTQYFFEVLPDALDGALDRFSQFFIAPLFNSELVDRERHAVNSEYQLSIKSDGNRIFAVNYATANPQHPIVRFSMGSIETLGDDPKRTPVREALMQFYADYYTADRMVLVVVAPQTIAQLEKMVVQYFGPISKHAVKPNQISEVVFTKNETGKQLSIQSLGDYSEIMLSFPIPSQRDSYNSKSIEYIIYQLQQSSNKSLYQFLKAKNWIIDIYASSSDITYNQDIANIGFSLTNLGAQHIDEVVRYTFEYINFLTKAGPQAEIFSELKSAGERNFIYGEKQKPIDYASALPQAMQDYPLDQVLVAGSFNKDTVYDPAAIKELLTYFAPKNMRLIIINKDVQGDQLEAKYQVKYSLQNFTSEQMGHWSNIKDSGIFGLMEANKYLPQNFTLLPVSDKSDNALPQKVATKTAAELWYKQDQTFKLPRQNMDFLLAVPNFNDTAKHTLLSIFMRNVINDKLSDLSSKFALAGVDVSVDKDTQGLVLSLAMFSDKQLDVIQDVVKVIMDYKIDPAKFVGYKEDVMRDLVNIKQKQPFYQAMFLANNLLYKNSWPSKQLLVLSSAVTVQEVEQFTQTCLQNIQLKALIHGNIDQATSVKIIEAMAQQLNVNATNSKLVSADKIIRLKNGTRVNYNFDPNHNDSTIVSYYQAQNTDDKTIATNALLVDVMDSPMYEQLRTKEQLGYVVGLRLLRVREQTGTQFYTESATKSASYVAARLAAFLLKFKNQLAHMPAKDLATYKDSLQARLLEKPSSLADETNRYWAEILSGEYRFNLYQDIANQVPTILLQDLNLYYNNLWLNPKTQRIITVSSIEKKGALINFKVITNIADFKAKAVYK